MRRAKRRRNGEGSYFTNPKTGITSFKISKRELSGKDRRHIIYQKHNETIAQFRARCQAFALDVNANSAGLSITINTVIDRWLSKGFTGTDKTRDGYQWHFDRLIKPTPFGRLRAGTVKAHQIAEYLDQLPAKSQDQKHRVFKILRAAFGYAYRIDLIPANTMTKITPPKVEREHAQALTRAEQARFMAAAKELAPQYYAYLYCIAGVRGRPAEIAALTVDDVHLTGPVPYVRNRGTKNRAADRVTPITQQTAAVIRAHLMQTGARGTDLLFTSPKGPIIKSTLRKAMAKINAAAGTSATLYDLRATGITRYAEAGVSEVLRLESQGHSLIDSEHSYRSIDVEAWGPELKKVESLI